MRLRTNMWASGLGEAETVWSKQNEVLAADLKKVAVWVGARDLCGGTTERFRRLSFSSQVPEQEEWVCAKWEFWGVKVGTFWSWELRMVCYHSTSTPPVLSIQSMMWQQGHTYWSPTPELDQLLPGSASLLLAELMHWIHPNDVPLERLLQQSHQLTATGVQSSLVRQPLCREDVCWAPQEFSPNKNCRARIAVGQWNNLYHHREIYDPDNFERCPYDV